MFRIVIPCTPIYGHLAPMVAVGRALVERGHSVTVLTGAKWRTLVEDAGLGFVPLPASVDYDDNDFDAFLPGRGRLSGIASIRHDLMGLFIGTIPAQYRALLSALADRRYDAVIAEAGFLGTVPLMRSASVGERVPIIGVSAVPVTFTSVDTAPFGLALLPGRTAFSRLRNRVLTTLIHAGPFKPVQAALDRAVKEVDAPPVEGNFFDQFVTHDVTLQLAPAGIEYPRRELPDTVRFIGPLPSQSSGADHRPSWWSDLDAGTPIVHVTQGTLDTMDFRKLLVPTIVGLADEDVLVVASTGGRPLAALLEHFPGGLPGNARVAEYLPYADLLPKTDVVVTNGGFGGVQLALANGVPLVVAGGTEDKPEVAARVAWSGTGVNVRTGTPGPDKVRRAVRQVLERPSYRQAADRLREEIRRLGDPVATIEATVAAQVRAHRSGRTGEADTTVG